MKIAIIGGGGREHAILRAVRRHPGISRVYMLPGNAGMAGEAEITGISATDLPAISAFCQENAIDYCIVSPDDPLVMGCVDLLEEKGIPCFGPNRNAAILEGSKVFAKAFMARHHIPTAACQTFTELDAALSYAASCDLPIVVKADGLALGKGVVIAFTRAEAEDAVRNAMERHAFGKSGEALVMEEYLTGPEVSVLAFTDGKTVVPMVSSMDHKRAKDGDQGLNTGGMGTIAPNPYYTDAVAQQCMETIFLPTIRGMAEEGRPFRGCLYFGLMLTPNGPRVIEYNCRFGDPETQVVLPLLQSDLLDIMRACTNGTLSPSMVRFSQDSACCVILASSGYPTHYEKGFPISIPEDVLPYVYVAGAADREGTLVTSGGRVLGVTATAPELKDAIALAYARADRVRFEGAFCRRDIGQRALRAGKET